MKRLLFAAVAMLVMAGCRSNPYCLNCKDGGNGVIGPLPDLAQAGPDLVGSQGPLPDMTGMSNGMCVPTNGGVEICDGLDNDCDGIIDNVDPSKLTGDPNNCGMCGKACTYVHAFGVCMNSTCSMGMCQPGYIDLNNNPADGCEYTCTPTANPAEICDGKDNNCDGQVDEGFTATWSDAQHQHPNYDNNIDDCGQCGTVCNLGPGTVMACTPGSMGRGQCTVSGCFNGLDTNGVHQTYRHDPVDSMGNLQSIDVTGCEYHCPFAANEINTDCNPDGACTFPAETCNGKDDDCNFKIDDGAAQPAMMTRCPDGTPGKLCSDGLPAGSQGQCVGQCKAGFLSCTNGAIICDPATVKGPSPEVCDDVDNDCNGKIDDPFTNTWQASGEPSYDKDPNNCGGCVPAPPSKPGGVVCSFPLVGGQQSTIPGCHAASAGAVGTCYALACEPGYNYVAFTNAPGAAPSSCNMLPEPGACNVAAPGPKNTVGCFYKCGVSGSEVCDGLDNDCNGCVDDGVVKPGGIVCASTGVCGSKALSATCQGGLGWSCNYSSVQNASVDTCGNLIPEYQCDGLDNDCDGNCDQSWPDVAVVANPVGPPAGTTCGNPHNANTCTAGLGVCQATASYTCVTTAMHSGSMPDTESCTATPVSGNATNEVCDGKDNNCDGQIDEATPDPTKTAKKGWHDPVVTVAVPAYPVTPSNPCPDDPPSLCNMHTVYMYQYEATRPAATAVSTGSLSTRACGTSDALPWTNVTLAQAQAACAAIKTPPTKALPNGTVGRLCTAWEWTHGCNESAASGTHWSTANAATTPPTYLGTYTAAACNDANETNQSCATGSDCASGTCTNNFCTCAVDGDCHTGFSCVNKVCTGDERCTAAADCRGTAGSTGTCNANNVCTCTTDNDCNPGYKCNGGTAPKVCTGGGVWPTGTHGAAAVACFTPWAGFDQLGAAAPNAGAYDLTGNVSEWTSTPATIASGTGATVSSVSNGILTLTGLTAGVYATDVGATLLLSGSTNVGNTGSFIIDSVTASGSTTTVTLEDANGVAPDASPIGWSLIYYKNRGGSYSSPAAGDACEFDYVLSKADFFNTDLGFRCCFDAQP
jgi:hypothetical protein